MTQHVANIVWLARRCDEEADVVSQEMGEEKELESGLCDLLVLMAITQEQQD